MGWQWVGEHGPEFIVIRPDARVIANREARGMSKVEIRMDAMGRGTVLVDGHDLSSMVYRVEFDGSATSPESAVVVLHMRAAVDIDAEARVDRVYETCTHKGDRADAGTAEHPDGFICLDCGKYVQTP